jgi:ABC-type uncharacterized transport system substrate-binding protein
MTYILRRIAAGVALILACSAVLLLLDLNHRNAKKAPGHRKWKVTVIEFIEVLDVEESEKGVLQGLRDAKLQEGVDYELKIVNAQGDMPTVSTLIDSAVSERSDLLITMSTPTLQAALKRAGKTPVVFTYLADAIAAGAARSDTDHAPNVTGVYFHPAFDEMLSMIRQCIPEARTIGSLYVPAEANMVFHKEKLEEASKKAGFKLITLPVNTSSDVPDASLALCSKNIDAICQVPGNLVAASFPSVIGSANQAKVPIFSFQTSQVHEGAVMALARDYLDAGVETGLMAARVIRGENPATIPLVSFSKTRIILNFDAARKFNLHFPQDLIRHAKETIGN